MSSGADVALPRVTITQKYQYPNITAHYQTTVPVVPLYFPENAALQAKSINL